MRRLLRFALPAALALFALGIVAAYQFLRPPPFVFVERSDAPGFRDLVRPGADRRATLAPADPAGGLPAGGLCAALFDDPAPPRLGSGPITAVYFTDFRCPYCREMDAALRARAASGEITLIFREWPILGPASVEMARLALAADRQGAFEAASARLVSTPFVPTPAYAADLARSLGIDGERLVADARSPETTAALRDTDALARSLGIRGTPALVIGRTVTRREIRPGDLDRLIAEEAKLGPPPC